MTFMQDNYNNVVDLLNSSYTASLGSMTGLMAEHFNVIPRRNKWGYSDLLNFCLIVIFFRSCELLL